LANSLPGGEVTVEEQDEVIAMLEGMRESKQSVISDGYFCFNEILTDEL
jgi:hypothetical protein